MKLILAIALEVSEVILAIALEVSEVILAIALEVSEVILAIAFMKTINRKGLGSQAVVRRRSLKSGAL